MKRSSIVRSMLAAAGLVLAVWLLAGCGPKYPNCSSDKHCASHNQVCVDKMCRDCRTDSQCNKVDACMACTSSYTCARKPGCCKSDLDCPGGRCWKDAGAAVGQCGGMCQTADHCPAGQRCVGGSCVPDVACYGDTDCGPGKKCQNGQCVDAACEPVAIYFDFNESVIRLDQESRVQANASCLKENTATYRVEGHCDERGSDEYNLALGQRRAGSVVRQYKSLGVSANRLSTISYGEERPVCSESSESCWQQNRRAETVPR